MTTARTQSSLVLFALVIVGAVTAPGAAGQEAGDPLAGERARAESEKAAWIQQRMSSTGRERRAASRSAHRGLGREAAWALARERIAGVFGRPLADPLLLPNGLRVKRFLSEDRAAVETATGEPLGVLVSTGPVATERDGVRAAIRLGLERRADGRFEPANPARQYSLPGRANQTVRLAESGTKPVRHLMCSNEQ